MPGNNIIAKSKDMIRPLTGNPGKPVNVTLTYDAEDEKEARAVAATIVMANHGDKSMRGEMRAGTLDELLKEHGFSLKAAESGSAPRGSITILAGALRSRTSWMDAIIEMLSHMELFSDSDGRPAASRIKMERERRVDENIQYLREHPEAREWLTELSAQAPGLQLLLHPALLKSGNVANPTAQYLKLLTDQKGTVEDIVELAPDVPLEACRKFINEACVSLPPRNG